MLNNSHEILFLVARDFVQLTPLQQISVGMKIGVVGIDSAVQVDKEALAESVFAKAFKAQKIPDLVKEMRTYLYE